jgi:hypothetical protein
VHATHTSVHSAHSAETAATMAKASGAIASEPIIVRTARFGFIFFFSVVCDPLEAGVS